MAGPKSILCMYCKTQAELKEDKGKKIMVCPNCGKKELTKLGIARIEASGK